MSLFKEIGIEDALAMVDDCLPDPDMILQAVNKTRGDLWREMMADSHIYDSALKRRLALQSRPFELDRPNSRESKLLMPMIRRLWPTICYLNTMRLGAGYAVGERIYQKGEGNRVGERAIERLAIKPLGMFSMMRDGSLKAKIGGQSQWVKVDHQYKFWLLQNDPTSSNPYGDAILTRLFWPWFFKKAGAKSWAHFIDRYAKPLVEGRKDGNDTERADLARSIWSAISRGVIVTEPSDSITIHQMKQGSGDAQERYEQFWIRAIRIMWQGHNMGSEVTGQGAHSAVGAASDCLDMLVDADAEALAPSLANLIESAAELMDLARAPVIRITNPRATRSKTMIYLDEDKKLTEIGVSFTPKYIARRYGLRPDEFKMAGSGAAFAGPGTMAAGTNTAQRLAGPVSGSDQLGELADLAIEQAGQPIKPTRIVEAIEAANDESELAQNLAGLIKENKQFQTALLGSIFTADIMGYADAENETRGRLSRWWNGRRLKKNTWEPLPPHEAIEAAEKRGIVLPDVYYGELQGVARGRAFSIAGFSQIEQIGGIWDIYKKALAKGTSLDNWKDEIRVAGLDLGLPDHRLDTIFRTAIAVDYAAGRYLKQESARDLRPFGMIRVIEDGRTRDDHLGHRNFIAPLDDAIWKKMDPPNGYNCRCRKFTLTSDEAKERGGVTENREGIVADKGWDYSPGNDRNQGLKIWAESLSESIPEFLEEHAKGFAENL